jgi:hypothetical protein
MTARRPIQMRLLIVASIVAGVSASQPARADPFGSSDVIRTLPARTVYYRAGRGVTPRRAHYLPAAHDRFDPVASAPVTADVLPLAHDARQPRVKLAPETVHYERSPIGLDDSPTTFGLVAQF